MTRTQSILDDLAEWYAVPSTSVAAESSASTRRSWYMSPEVGHEAARPRGMTRIAEAFLAWHDRSRQRRALMQMSDHMLRDVGISRADALGEATKPFWRN